MHEDKRRALIEKLTAVQTEIGDLMADAFTEGRDGFIEKLHGIEGKLGNVRDWLNAEVVCPSCGWTGGPAECAEIRDWEKRMGTADEYEFGLAPMPSGECPECGSLAYDETVHVAHQAAMRFLRAQTREQDA